MRVLVVEDEKRLAASLKRGLEADGFAVDVALTGTDGLWMAREHTYDAIVLDIMLPGLNGYVVCGTLRDEGIWSPVLMLTAKDGELDEAEALDTGADDFLRKPFSHVVLVARLRAIMRRGSQRRPTSLCAGDLRLDPARHRVWRGTVEVALSPKELALLELLMRHAGEVVTRTQLLDHVWDFAYDGLSNVVDQYVSYLRRKIDHPFDRSDIETVRGVGYRLRDGDE